MASHCVFLSYPLSPQTPTPPAIPRIELAPFMSLERGDDANVTLVKVMTHTGTHVDAPRHVVSDGLSVSDFRPEELVFRRPRVFDLPLRDDTLVMPSDLEGCADRGEDADLVLFRFGYGAVRASDPERYARHCPGFGIESARFLLRSFPRMRALGMDVPSLACVSFLERTMRAHNVLLEGASRRFWVIEDMDLGGNLERLATVIVAPWWIAGADGGPATILGFLGPEPALAEAGRP